MELIGYYERYTSVDAVISLGGLPSFVYGHEIPLLVRGADPEGMADVRLLVDVYPALEELVEFFLKTGRQNMAFIGEPLMGGGGWNDNMQVYQLTDTVQVVLAGANRNVISQGEYGDLQCVSDPILYGIIAPAKLLAPKKIGQIQTGYVIDGNIIYGVNCNAFINEFDGSMEILMGIRRLPARRSMKCFRGGNTRS